MMKEKPQAVVKLKVIQLQTRKGSGRCKQFQNSMGSKTSECRCWTLTSYKGVDGVGRGSYRWPLEQHQIRRSCPSNPGVLPIVVSRTGTECQWMSAISRTLATCQQFCKEIEKSEDIMVPEMHEKINWHIWDSRVSLEPLYPISVALPSCGPESPGDRTMITVSFFFQHLLLYFAWWRVTFL